MQPITFLSILACLVLAGAAGYVIYSNAPGEMHTLVPIAPAQNEPPTPPATTEEDQSKQFYPNMRFPSSTITYYVESACNDKKESEVRSAMDYFEENTQLLFVPVEQDDAQLLITCSQLAPQPHMKNHFVAGEGGPTEVLNTSLYVVILSAKISLYREERCENPNIALHELLHVLGFDHNENAKSILYPSLDCDQRVDSYLIDEITRLYQAREASDLAFVQVNASKSGPYLSFVAEMTNQGLETAEGVVLVVKADGDTVKEFSLDSIDIGTKKTLTVDNLRIPRSAREITFTLDPQNRVDELFENNNNFNLAVSN